LLIAVFIGFFLSLGGCCHGALLEGKMETNDRNTADPKEPSCVEPLRRLVQGDFALWQGLAGDCDRAAVAAALGGSNSEEDLVGHPGGIPTGYRIYPATAAAPYGIFVWYEEDRAVALQIHSFTPQRPVLDQLGEPEARELSRMPGFKTQWIYAVRGLTLHVDDDSGAVAWLYGYRPMSLDVYRASWLFRVEILRHRIQ
jgi:hypothetical protein